MEKPRKRTAVERAGTRTPSSPGRDQGGLDCGCTHGDQGGLALSQPAQVGFSGPPWGKPLEEGAGGRSEG